MSRRPKMAPLPVIWPSPLKSVNRPLTLIRPHMFLILTLTVDRSGSRFHTPAVSGSFSSVSTVVMCAAPPHRFALHRRRRGSCARLLLIASLCLVVGAGHVRRSFSSLRSASSSARVMCAAPSHRFALHRRRRGSCAPLLRCRLAHQRRDLSWVEVLVDTADQGVDTQLNHDAHAQGDRCTVAAGGMQDVLLDEAVGEQ